MSEKSLILVALRYEMRLGFKVQSDLRKPSKQAGSTTPQRGAASTLSVPLRAIQLESELVPLARSVRVHEQVDLATLPCVASSSSTLQTMSTTPTALTGAVPRGAAYAGAPNNYAADHIESRIEVDEDRGITVFSPETYSQGGLLRVAQDRITKPGTIAEPTSDAASKGARKPDPEAKGVQIC